MTPSTPTTNEPGEPTRVRQARTDTDVSTTVVPHEVSATVVPDGGDVA